jgi:hypothetical protein
MFASPTSDWRSSVIVHFAAFRWLEATTDDEIVAMSQALRDIALDVEGIERIECGSNVSPFGRGLSHGVLVIAAHPAALDSYRAHPNHVRAAAKMDVRQDVDGGHQPGIVIDFVARAVSAD